MPPGRAGVDAAWWAALFGTYSPGTPPPGPSTIYGRSEGLVDLASPVGPVFMRVKRGGTLFQV